MATGDPWVFRKQEQEQKVPAVVVGATTNSIVLNSAGEEMLRVAEDGFYVRGIRVPADDKEAEEVYNAFKQWLSWSVLNK